VSNYCLRLTPYVYLSLSIRVPELLGNVIGWIKEASVAD